MKTSSNNMKNIYLLSLLFLFGCSSSLSPVDDGLEKQIFHFGNGSEPQGIDPHIVTGLKLEEQPNKNNKDRRYIFFILLEDVFI